MKRTESFVGRLFTALFLAAAIAAPAAAVTDEEIFRDFRFNFANPGARALAMGGAFIAIANDATAAQANPARLGVLRRPEIFAEVRNRNTNASGRNTGDFLIDPTINPSSDLSLNSQITPETQTVPSVVSFVYPFKLRRALTVGVSRQEILSVKSAATNQIRTIPLIASPIQDPNNPEQVTNSSAGSVDSKLVLYNLSAGYQITRDLFVGGSVIFGQLDFKSNINSTFADPDALFGYGNLDPRFETPAGSNLISTSINDSDTDVKWAFGLFWKLNDELSFGTVYKKGVRMSLQEKVTDNSFAPNVAGPIDTTFNVPDLSGFGIAYQPWAKSSHAGLQSLLFALDVVRVENKDLVAGFQSGLNVVTLNDFIKRVDFTASNQTEIHFGAEYYLNVGRSTLAFRGGFFTDPDSSIHSTNVVSDGSPTQTGTRTAIEKGNIFPSRSTVNHVTGGVGYSFSDWEIAAAFDNSSLEKQGVLSVIYRFKR
ncbi:MAG: outer membrane protein transport protein [Acidobacteria bacterium]|nr:outer membrane protein transport protein [Acidobacteriota bacterium]